MLSLMNPFAMDVFLDEPSFGRPPSRCRLAPYHGFHDRRMMAKRPRRSSWTIQPQGCRHVRRWPELHQQQPMLEDPLDRFSRQLMEYQPSTAMSSFGNMLYEVFDGLETSLSNSCIAWSTDSKHKDEALGKLRLPEEVRRSKDLKMELDENSRMLTLSCDMSEGPSRRSFWKVSQRLDDSLDLSKLEASFNKRQGTIEFRTPICEQQQQQQQIQLEEEEKEEEEEAEKSSEVEQEPSDIEENEEEEEENSESSVKSTEKQKMIEVEDIGPDEMADHISVSSESSSE